MRRALVLLVTVLASCSKGDATADSTAATALPDSAAPAAAAAPAALTAADIQGEWQGRSMAATGDSVLSRWTLKSVTDSTGVLTYDDTKQTVNYRVRFDADSLVSTSEPYAPSGAPKGTMVTFRAVGRMQGDNLAGTTYIMTAAKPDSAASSHPWVATRKP